MTVADVLWPRSYLGYPFADFEPINGSSRIFLLSTVHTTDWQHLSVTG